MTKQYSREEFAAKLGANGDPKLNAAADFAARLLSSPVGDSIARIVLFGSVARGEARPESDVDVLVIGTDDLELLETQASHSAYDMLLEGSDYVSPLVYGLSDAAFPQTYFLYNVLRVGKEVYQMDESQLRRNQAQVYERLADEFIRSAEHALQGQYWRAAVDDAYNAAELAAKGLLLLRIQEMPTSHGGVAQMFGKVYVASGDAPRELGRKLSMNLDLRHKARYDGQAKVDENDAKESIVFAKQMLEFLNGQLASG